MFVIRKIIAVLSTVALAVLLVGAGFLACIVPPVTSVLANLFSDDATSPFSRTQLVQVAEATRDYSFGAHDVSALYRAIYQADLQLRQEIVNANGALPFAFPQLDRVSDPADASQLEAAFAGASEMYCFTPDTVSHLDDCFNLSRIAFTALIVVAAVALAGLVFCGIAGGRRLVGSPFLVAGIAVIVAFVALGVFAALDFQRFFATFHQLFFSQGNWQFAYDSLLICALPAQFWVGMGAVWLFVSVLAALVSIATGRRLRVASRGLARRASA